MHKAKKRKALHDFMTPAFWRTHHIIPAFIALVGLGMALGIAHFSTLQPYKALATTSDNVLGWAYASNAGWFSLNDQNPTACGTGSCGTYGLNVALTSSDQPDGRKGHKLDGFAWSDNVGFVCFGASCSNPACLPSYQPNPPNNGYYAYVEPITDPTPKKVRGWAVICNQKDLGLISLNCEDTGTCNDPALPGDLNYRVIYDPASTGKIFYTKFYKAIAAMTQGVSFGWNGNDDTAPGYNGSGIGYIDFYPEWVGGGGFSDGMHINATEDCSVVGDEDLNGRADCSDPVCKSLPQCAEVNSKGPSIVQQYQACHDDIDNDNNDKGDCSGVTGYPTPDDSCLASAVCKPEANCNNAGVDDDGDGAADCNDHPDCDLAANCLPESVCDNGLDDDSDGKVDCDDTDCASASNCLAQPDCEDTPACLLFSKGTQERKNCCCNDSSENNGHPMDCLDPVCVVQAPKICSAWSRVETGNIYAGGGITGTQAPKATGVSNVTYCLRSNGEIDWTSGRDCKETVTNEPLQLPTFQTGYRNKLGFLDLAGIRNGRYGEVVALNEGDPLPKDLGGKVYRFTGDKYTLKEAVTFNNGSPTTGRGNGLLFIDGGFLDIPYDVKYTSDPVSGSLRNLASFGIIVVKGRTIPSAGDIYIEPGVNVVSGTLFAEGTITTLAGTPPDKNLKIYGILVANQFKLLRDNQDPANPTPATPAEEIIFDGRAVANPPPGMQDISRSLPRADFNY